MVDGIAGSAVFSACGRYRYRLARRWGAGEVVAFVLLNPNRADATVNDPTIRRAIGFAQAWGFGGLEVVNLFGWRCRDPRELAAVDDPVGPDNDRHVREAVDGAALVVAAWGDHGSYRGRDREVVARLGRPLLCFGRTKRGQPRHPLYLRRDALLVSLADVDRESRGR